MGYSLGWQRMIDANPYIDGTVWNDGISRNNANVVSYSFNFCCHVVKSTGYWNYAWYVNMACGNNVSNDRLVKARHSGSNLRIGGIDYYQSNYNGNFTGSIGVGGKETQIVVRCTFHDSAGNWGWDCYWGCGIPTASSMSKVKVSATNITEDSARLSGSITGKGNYSAITKWRLEYGKNAYNEHTLDIDGDAMSRNWDISGLEDDTTYKYHITCWNSAGYVEWTEGTFKTKEKKIAYKVVEDILPQVAQIWVVRPDVPNKRVKYIQRVE